MSSHDYYEKMKFLARQTRQKHNLNNQRILRSDLRLIYKANNINFDLWPKKGTSPEAKLKKLRGAFFNDEYGSTIMISRNLPNDPAVFTMCHEFKHFLVDKELGQILCTENNINKEIEIGAEVFAAEMIFPDQDFIQYMRKMSIEEGKCQPEDIVHLKHETNTTLSYQGMAKKAEFLKFALPNSLIKIRWKKLEETLYGLPIYKTLLKKKKNESA